MYKKTTLLLCILCISVMISGCSALFSQQEWSENYALLDGTQATNPQMIDGNMETVGTTNSQNRTNNRLTSSPAPEIVVSLPEKKIVRKVVIHSDNIKKLKLYSDKGGNPLADTDWQLIKEIKSVTSDPIVVPILYSFPTDKIRLVVLATSDDASLTRSEKARDATLATLSSGST